MIARKVTPGFLVAAIATLLPGVSVAQTPGVYRVGGGVKAGVLISKQEPQYSEEARAAKLQGTVVLAIVIGEDGQPRDLRVIKSLGLGLDEKAVESVAQWRFQPGEKEGRPVAVEATIEVNFRLLGDPRVWSVSGARFTAPPGATPPSILKAPPAAPSGLPENATARVAFDVDPQGVPINIQVEESSDPKWNDEVIALIREWRFQAALESGTAIESHAVFDLTRGLTPPAAPGAPPMKKRE